MNPQLAAGDTERRIEAIRRLQVLELVADPATAGALLAGLLAPALPTMRTTMTRLMTHRWSFW